MPRTGAEPSVEALRVWLTAKVAEYAECEPDQIRPDVSLAEYGLDSMYGLMLCGDIEDHLGLTVDPTDGDGQKSSHYGIFNRGSDGHREEA